MDSSISIPLDLSGIRLPAIAPSLPLVQRKPVEEVVAPPVERAKMQPHIGYAFLLTLGLFAVLTAVQVVWGIVAVAVILASGLELNATSGLEFGTNNAGVILLTLLASSCIYCLGVASIAFRGQMVERLSVRKLTKLQLAAVVLMAMPLAMVISHLAAAVMALLGWDAAGTTNIVSQPQTLALALFSIAVLPAIGEEVFFRGLLSRGLIARHGVILGVLFATGLFALIHANPVQVFVIFFMGLVMQAVFMWTRSILGSMLLHGLYNATIVIAGRNATGTVAPELETMMLPLIAASLITVIALLVVLYQTRTRWQLPDGNFWSPGYVATDMPSRNLNAVAVNAKAKLSSLTIVGLSFATLAAMLIISGSL